MISALSAIRTMISDWRLSAAGGIGPDGDISVYIGAVNYLKSGGALYDYPIGGGYGFTYPPFAAVALDPLTWLSPRATGLVWLTVCEAIAVLIAVIVVLSRLPAPDLLGRLIFGCLGVAVFLGSVQVQSDLITGQVNLILALLIVLDVGRFVPERWRGTLVGLAAAVKLTPMVIWAWFLLTRQWRALGNSLGVFVGCGMLGWALIPSDSRQFWTETIFETGRVGDVELRFNTTVMGTLARAGVDGTARTLLWLILGGLLVLAAYWNAQRARRYGDGIAAAILLGCAAVIASPIAWPHHQIWLPLAGLVLVMRRRWGPRIAGLAIVLFAYFHVPLTRLWDSHGLGWLFNNVDFAMFVGVCLSGLAVERPVASASDESATCLQPPLTESPSARRSPSTP